MQRKVIGFVAAVLISSLGFMVIFWRDGFICVKLGLYAKEYAASFTPRPGSEHGYMLLNGKTIIRRQ